MREVIDDIQYGFLYKISEEDSYFYVNLIHTDFSLKNERFILKDNIIEDINNYYLPFFQNFDRIHD